MTSLITTTSLKKSYGVKEQKFDALRGVNLSIEQGEKLAIIGKSGSGKSTLLHLLGLLDTPTSGKIELDGTDVTSLSTRQLNRVRNQTFGFIFQQFFLNPRQTVSENVEMPLVIAGMKPDERRKKTKVALESVGLDGKSFNRALDLSGGQRQRVAIARAIVHEPKIVLADEPTGNLDSRTSEQVEELLSDLHAHMGSTLIVVTHDPDLAKRLGRQVQVSDGEITLDTRGEVQ